jgi:hypothetical protein
VTSSYRPPAGRLGDRQADPPSNADFRTGEKDHTEISDPYDLPGPEDHWPPGRPAYLIVVDQLRDCQPARSPSLAELLETRPARTREPEPDLEAEP